MVEHLAKLQNRGKRMRFGEKSTITVAQPSTSATATARQPTPSATQQQRGTAECHPGPYCCGNPVDRLVYCWYTAPANIFDGSEHGRTPCSSSSSVSPSSSLSSSPGSSSGYPALRRCLRWGPRRRHPSTIAQSALPIQLGIPMFGTPPTGSIQGNTFNNLPGHAQQGATTQQLSISEAQSRFHQARSA